VKREGPRRYQEPLPQPIWPLIYLCRAHRPLIQDPDAKSRGYLYGAFSDRPYNIYVRKPRLDDW
jgi:hypothetical protein